jgi:hypothetical protein
MRPRFADSDSEVEVQPRRARSRGGEDVHLASPIRHRRLILGSKSSQIAYSA